MSAAPLALPPWHGSLWGVVAQAMEQERLGHALLLSGLRGTGKRCFARTLAAALWCERPAAGRLPCGQCGNCRQVLAGAHPGYTVLRPEEGKRDIAIEAVRGLCERLAMTSHNGGAKVAVIDPADALNRNGVNALLKTIEEPPPRSYVLLVAERPLALPATLRSRCQQLRFAIPPRQQALAWLAQGEGVATENLESALDAAHGAPMQAQQLLQEQQLARLQEWRGLLLDLAAGRNEPLKAAAAVGEDQAAAFLHWLYGWLLDLLRGALAPGTAADGAALARSLPRRQLDVYIAEVQDNLRRLEFNAKAQLVLEAVLIRWRGLVALGQKS
ncbi:MAG: DNA polymerase III subunit delta' [Nevskia sp.]|nr:DNA polymerase III subunit delta' [Nevskia sp.]